MTLASTAGGKIPIDAASLGEGFMTEDCNRFQADAKAQAALAESVPLASVDPAAFDVTFLPGGHGTYADFPSSDALAAGLTAAAAAGRVISAVCHGQTGLVGAKGPDGKPLVAGKSVTGFSNVEEEMVTPGPRAPAPPSPRPRPEPPRP